MDVADFVGQLQSIKSAQLRQRKLIIIDQVLPQTAAILCSVVVGSPIPVQLLIVQVITKTDIVEQPAVQTVQYVRIALPERELQRTDKLVDLRLQLEFQQLDLAILGRLPDYAIEVTDAFEHLPQIVELLRPEPIQWVRGFETIKHVAIKEQ